MKTERVALYARVSTLAGQSPEMQLAELREYAGRRGWSVIGEYVDHGVSGTKESRPALNRLMSDAKQRRFDVIAVWKIDRFGRSLRHLVNSLAELESLGVSFVSLRDSLDLVRRLGGSWRSCSEQSQSSSAALSPSACGLAFAMPATK